MGKDAGDAKKSPRNLEEDRAAESGRVPRETVRPGFDPQRYVENVMFRERAATITDEVAIEEARIASVLMDSRPPRRSSDAPDLAVTYEDAEGLEVELSQDEQLAILRSALGPLSGVPKLTRPLEELGSWATEPKVAYVLSFVDGLLPLETIIEVAGLPERDILTILSRALDEGALQVRR